MELVIGLGNKARNGKDTVAKMLQNKLNNCFIIHFADALKNEVTKQDKEPLIRRVEKNKFKIRDYVEIWESEYLENIFQEKGIEVYEYMKEKDPKILQFWGTQFKRSLDDNIWINEVKKFIQEKSKEFSENEPIYFLIPDTRFKNEKNFIKENNGIFCKVKRINLDGTQFIDPSRNNNHPSEIDLDDVDGDYLIEARDLKELERKVDKFLDFLNINFHKTK